MSARALLVATLLALTACGPKDDTTDDTDPNPIDTDIDTVDTDVDTVDTDDTEVVDTQVDSDTDVATLTIQGIRLDGDAVPGDLVRIEDVMVTGVRQDGTGFVVQDVGVANYAGMVVKVASGDPLPAPGTRVTITAVYRETGSGSVPLQTSATLDTTTPSGEVVTLGAGTLPTPTTLAFSSSTIGQPEPYESMLVKLNGALVVAQGPLAGGAFTLEPPPSSSRNLGVGAWFINPSDDFPDLGPGASFGSIAGIFQFDVGTWTIQPTGPTAFFAYQPPDTDVPDTQVDTDTGDTFPFVETGCVDTECDTGGSGTSVVIGTPQEVHQGLYQSNSTIITVQDVIVTGVRDGPAAQDWFTIQTPTGAVGAALWIDATDSQAQGLTLPSVGDSIDVTGMYVEFNTLGAAPGTSTQSRLQVNNLVWGQTGWTVKSSGNPMPPAVDLTVASFQSPATMEAVESALVRLIDATDLQMTSTGPQRVSVTGSTDYVQLDNTAFYNIGSDYSLSVGRQMTSITGVAVFKFNQTPPWRLGARSSADVVGFR